MDKSLQKVIENNLEVNTDGDDYVFTLNKNTNSHFFSNLLHIVFYKPNTTKYLLSPPMQYNFPPKTRAIYYSVLGQYLLIIMYQKPY